MWNDFPIVKTRVQTGRQFATALLSLQVWREDTWQWTVTGSEVSLAGTAETRKLAEAASIQAARDATETLVLSLRGVVTWDTPPSVTRRTEDDVGTP